QRADARRVRARRAGRRHLLRDDAGAGLRPVGAAGRRRRGGPRVPPMRAPRRTALPARHRRLHAPRRARRGAGRGARGAGSRWMTAVTALILAGRGGARLERTLASVAWAGRRTVWDPDGRLARATLPANVTCVREAGEAAADGWLLLL